MGGVRAVQALAPGAQPLLAGKLLSGRWAASQPASHKQLFHLEGVSA